MCHTWEHRNDTPFHMCMQASYAKNEQGPAYNKKEKTKKNERGQKKKKKETRFRRDSDVRTVVALTRGRRRVDEFVKLRRKSYLHRTCFDFRRVKKNRAFIESGTRCSLRKKGGKKKNGAERRPEHKNKRVSQKKDFEESSVRDRALKFLLKRTTITCNSFRSSRSEKFLR